MLQESYIAEFIGTMSLIYVIMDTGNPIAIVGTLLAAILTAGKISGGHFNPAVSVASFVRGTMSQKDLLAYVAAQVLGGIVALQLKNVM